MDICVRNGAVQGECHVDVSIGLGSPMQSGIRNDAEKIYRHPWETLSCHGWSNAWVA